ncbi:MAG TPA: acyl carrier protein [Terriglobales bacterium]|nr:acyl carrier protein [Terriglobales bacterium]
MAPALHPLHDPLRRFIFAELANSPLRPLDPDAPLFESLLDSTSVLALVTHLEQQFHLEILDHEVVPANFSTLRCLCAFLDRKSQSTSAAA